MVYLFMTSCKVNRHRWQSFYVTVNTSYDAATATVSNTLNAKVRGQLQGC